MESQNHDTEQRRSNYHLPVLLPRRSRDTARTSQTNVTPRACDRGVGLRGNAEPAFQMRGEQRRPRRWATLRLALELAR